MTDKTTTKWGLKEAAGAIAAAILAGGLIYWATEVFAWVRALQLFS